MRRTHILAALAGLGLAAAVVTPALAQPEISEGSQDYRDRTACATWSFDRPVEGGDEGETEHVNVYACGTLVDADGDGADDDASVQVARYIDGHAEGLYRASVDLADVAIDPAGGTASINTLLPADDLQPECAVSLAFTATGDPESSSSSSSDIYPQLGEGVEVQVVTGRDFSSTSRTATAEGSVCGWAEAAGPSTDGFLAEDVTTSHYTSVAVHV